MAAQDQSTIAQSYAKAKFFDLAMNIVDRMLDLRTASLRTST